MNIVCWLFFRFKILEESQRNCFKTRDVGLLLMLFSIIHFHQSRCYAKRPLWPFVESLRSSAKVLQHSNDVEAVDGTLLLWCLEWALFYKLHFFVLNLRWKVQFSKWSIFLAPCTTYKMTSYVKHLYWKVTKLE